MACQEAELDQPAITQAPVKHDKNNNDDDDDVHEELEDEIIAEHSDVNLDSVCNENPLLDLLDEYLTEFDDVPHEVK